MYILSSNIILILIIAVTFFGKANTVAIAAGILLVLKVIGLEKYTFPFIEKNGISYGIIVLLVAILLPIASGNISADHIKNIFISWIGVAALLLSFFTTYLSGQGLNFLTTGHSEVMPSLIIGSILATTFLGGLPVGPFITCGMLVVLIKIFENVHS